jgi:hypothetical protein
VAVVVAKMQTLPVVTVSQALVAVAVVSLETVELF